MAGEGPCIAVRRQFGGRMVCKLCTAAQWLETSDRELRRDGEAPALDGPRGRRDRLAALRPAHQPADPAPRRRGRDHHLPEARAQDCCGSISASNTRRERAASPSTTPRTSRSSVERRTVARTRSARRVRCSSGTRTEVTVPPDGTGALKETGPQAIGKSRGVWSIKIRLVAADACSAIGFSLSASQAGEAPQGRELRTSFIRPLRRSPRNRIDGEAHGRRDRVARSHHRPRRHLWRQADHP